MTGTISKDSLIKACSQFKEEEPDRLELLEATDGYCGYYDTLMDYERIYFYPEAVTASHIDGMLCMDKEVERFIDREKLIRLIREEIDPNALCVCRQIAFVWDEDGGRSEARQAMYETTGDEYALEAGESLCGLTWVDRQAVIICVSTHYEVACECLDILTKEIFEMGILETVFHEFRHLLYECNEILEIGTADYPFDGGIEENVESYAIRKAEAAYRKYPHVFKEYEIEGWL